MKKQTKLGEDVIGLTTANFLNLCVTTVTGMLLARFRSLEEYGTYSQLLLVISLFSSIFMLGLSSSINYFLSRCETAQEQQDFLSVYYTLSTILSLTMGAVLVCASPLIAAYFKNPAITGFLFFLALYPWAKVISSSIGNLLVVYKRTRFLIVYRLVSSVLLLGCVLLVQWLGFGFKEYVAFYLIVECFLAFSVYFIAGRLSGGIRFFLSKKMLKSILFFSLPLGLASIVGTLDVEIDKLLIGRLMDTEQLAVYAIAAKELPMTIIASSITAVLLPKFARMMKEKKDREAVALWNVATELSFIFMSLIVVGIFTFASEVIELLYSSKYLSGVHVFRVYALVLLLRVTSFGIMLNAMGNTKQIFNCSILALILNIVLNPALYALFGMVGPAIATFVSILLVALLQLGMTAKYTGESFARVFPWKHCGISLLVNGILAIAFSLLKAGIPLEKLVGNVLESILLGCVWTVVYALMMHKRVRLLWKELNEG